MNKLIGLTRNFSSSVNNAFKTVTVVGGGLMGSGIAQVAAQAGQNVTIVDLKPELLEKAQKSIHNNLTRVGKKLYKDDSSKIQAFVDESFNRIKVSTNIEDGAQADLIIEAIVEQLKPKQELFNKLDQLSPAHTVFATNTSSISVNEIGAGIKRKDRFGGLHFFNPVPVMRLLEVVKGDETSEATHAAMMEWGKAVGKTCITCKDTPGFVVNRLLGPYSAEAMRMYERDMPKELDIWDIFTIVLMRLLEVVKSDETSEATHAAMMEWGKAVGKTCITCKDTPGFVVNRLLGPYSAEAIRMYERGDATKEDIDIGMKLGAGYPMGPFELADYTGIDTNRFALQVMYEKTGDPVFRPIELLNKMVAEGKLGIKSGEGFYKYKK